jgi:MoaA/NifB/PqqE/SkfB family radical SAM enzyme
MTFEQIKTISETAPLFNQLWLSGGEPVLREDLAEIVRLFYINNGIKSLHWPTNGLLTQRIEEVTQQILDICPDLSIQLNFSLDGLGASHDNIRGVKGNFKRTITTMDNLVNKYGLMHPRLQINVDTVITPENYDEMFELAVYLFQKENNTIHFFEPVRGDPKDPNTKGITRKQLADLYNQLLPLYKIKADILFSELPFYHRWFAKMYFLGVTQFLFKKQQDNLYGPCPWGTNCTAGETTVVIDHDGFFRSCEMRNPVGHLKDYDFNLSKATQSTEMKEEIQTIGGGEKANCWCTHSCWVLASMQFSPKTWLIRIPWDYLKMKLRGIPETYLPHIDIQSVENYTNDTNQIKHTAQPKTD